MQPPEDSTRTRDQLMERIHTSVDSVSRLLGQTSDSARIDAEILLCHLLKRNRAHLRAWPELSLSQQQGKELERLMNARMQGVPIAYLTGMREFWSHEFEVDTSVLIPRPESELLVELALQRLPAAAPASIIDAGTGSGAIAVSLADERPSTQITAIDISPSALEVARRNASRLGTVNIRFVASDWFRAFREQPDFDLIVSNPPYIATDDPHLTRAELGHEPPMALKSGADGLDATRQIADGARRLLRAGGHLILEHGYRQGDAVRSLLEMRRFRDIETYPDLQGHPRATCARK